MRKKTYMAPWMETEDLQVENVLLAVSSDGAPTVEGDKLIYDALDGLGDSYSFGSDESVGAPLRGLFDF